MQGYRLIPDSRMRIKDYDPEFTDGMSKEEARTGLAELQERLSHLQPLLYADGRYALLVVLQAMDAGGKDGTIKSIFTGLNPQGVRVVSFKAPSETELAHDYLWRVHQQVPPKGSIGIFNRSHYEDVLVVRVNNLVPESVWSKRYNQINEFEELLSESNTVILKFFLNISRAEQKNRMQERLSEPEKNWKFSVGDLKVREQWDDYMQAYEAIFQQCSPPDAPWHIVPANNKWYRNYLITRTIVEALEKLPLRYPPPEEGLDQIVIPD